MFLALVKRGGFNFKDFFPRGRHLWPLDQCLIGQTYSSAILRTHVVLLGKTTISVSTCVNNRFLASLGVNELKKAVC
jgi:hypothetical protein